MIHSDTEVKDCLQGAILPLLTLGHQKNQLYPHLELPLLQCLVFMLISLLFGREENGIFYNRDLPL